MTRKLLPYEYDLIDTLGVTKEEYLDFLAVQQTYTDVKQDTVLDARNGVGVAAIVLAVIGLLAQVASILLAPKPNTPEGPGGQRRTRNERFSPRFGFNTQQELAKYGDPINLVYTDITTNTKGGVRLAGSLIWSAVRSYGSSQFVQMLMVLGAGQIRAINSNKSAFGQTTLAEITTENKWLYFRPNSTGALQWADAVPPSNTNDPTFYGSASSNPYRLQTTADNNRTDGFSQAYSPSTQNALGIYGIVPINVLVYQRSESGYKDQIEGLGIAASFSWTQFQSIPVGFTFQVGIQATNVDTTDVGTQAQEIRRAAASAFDDSGVFKLGSAKFRVDVINQGSPDAGDMTISLVCVESGNAPSVPYDIQDVTSYGPGQSYTKALVRFEEASYQTLQPCHTVDLAIKNNIYKQVAGRQEKYGVDNLPGYPASDNGNKNRTALFLLQYKIAGGSFAYVRGIFAISRANNIDNFNYIKFNSGKTALQDAQYWQFKLEPVGDIRSEIVKHPELRNTNGQVPYLYLENSGPASTRFMPDGTSIQFTGRVISNPDDLPGLNESPSGLTEWDLFNTDSDNQITFSFDNGPEMAVTCVTEQLIQPFQSYPKLYDDLSLIGFNIFSGRNLQDLKNFTAFVTQGRNVRRLRTSGVDENNRQWGQAGYQYLPSVANGATCFAPDIFIDSVLDPNDGIGKYAVIDGINVEQLARTKKFCEVNSLYMDGVIADPTSWREFWVQAAPFSLLEFARIGGQETLVPALPYDPNTGLIKRQINITALFNQGNIVEESYKEEYLDYGSNVQDVIATVIYRGTDINGTFSRNRTLEVKRADASETDAIRQTFDLSQFVTTSDQAVSFGKLLCNLRRYVRRSIEFRTFPTQDPVAPGAFIYVDIGQNAWNGIRTGVVDPGGALNIPLDNNLPNGTYKFLLYRSGNGVVSIETAVSANTASGLGSYEGWLFVLGTQIKSKRIFKVSEVQMDEEGEITVRASEYPCDANDNSLIADFNTALFTVTGALS